MIRLTVINRRQQYNRPPKNRTRVNYAIRSPQVRLILADGSQAGIIDIKEAQKLANTAELDLVEISPNANPPVCKIIDFGKYKFELEKKRKASKKNSQNTKLKEIRMQPKIQDHDLRFKVKHINEFLKAGNKVKVTIRFRGRELAYTQLGEQVLKSVQEMLELSVNVDKQPSMEGRFMTMIISPQKHKK